MANYDIYTEGLGSGRDVRKEYPHTFELRNAIEGLSEQVTALRHNFLGFTYSEFGMPDPEDGGLSDEIEALYHEIDSLKEELGILKEFKARDVLSTFRRTILELRQILVQAPVSGRPVFHLDELTKYWCDYEAWRKKASELAMEASLVPLRGEIERSQLLTHFQVCYVYDGGPEEGIRNRYDNYRRHPYAVPVDKVQEYGDSLAKCPSCGVSVGQLHLVSRADLPICGMEQCPYCHRPAVSCEHCEFAMAMPNKKAKCEPDKQHLDVIEDDEGIPF